MAHRPVIGNLCLISFPNLQVQYFNQRLVKSHLAEKVDTILQFQGIRWSRASVAGSWSCWTDEARRGAVCSLTSCPNPAPLSSGSLGGSRKAWHPQTTQRPSSGANKRPVLFFVLDHFCVFLVLRLPRVSGAGPVGRWAVSPASAITCLRPGAAYSICWCCSLTISSSMPGALPSSFHSPSHLLRKPHHFTDEVSEARQVR